MEMDELFLDVTDIDWFAVDQNGFLCHFATAGRGHVPPEVAGSMESWEAANECVDALPSTFDVLVVEAGLPAFKSEKQRQGYIAMHVEMARKGLHSHDACDGGYILVARPAEGSAMVILGEDAARVIPTLTIEYEPGGYKVRMP